MNNLIGQSLGRYHILEQLGEGGMATVYKAYDTRLERDVAVKVIRRGAFPPEHLDRILKRFEREAKALARLSHPNIVKVHDFGEHDGSPYLVLEYLSGGTLKSKLGKPMPWEQAFQLLLPIVNALGYAHRQKIVHRDIKPSNILLTEQGQPLLTDFGIAKLLELEDSQTLTGTGVGVGTPEYMAPEQGMGKDVDARADVYALGVVLYELLTGRKPYTADTPMAVVFKHMTDPLPRPGQFAPDLPDGVERLLLKALAKNAEDRYQTMDELGTAMQALLGRPAPAKDTLKTPPPKPGPDVDGLQSSQKEPLEDEVTTDAVSQTELVHINEKKGVRRAKVARGKHAWWPWVLIGVVLLVALVGWFSAGGLVQVSPTQTPTPTFMPEPTNTPLATIASDVPSGLLANILNRGYILVSTDPNYKPQSFLNTDGKRPSDTKCPSDALTTVEMQGFDVDMAIAIGDALGVETCFVAPRWDAITAGNWAGKWDISIGSMTITTERQKVLDFSIPYYYTPAVVAVLSDAAYTSLDDLTGEALCTGASTTYEAWLNKSNMDLPASSIYAQPPANVAVVTMDTDQECVQALTTGRGNFTGYITSQSVINANIATGLPVKQLGSPVFSEDLAIAFDRFSELDTESLRMKVNEIILSMRANGRLAALSNQWLGSDMTQPPNPGSSAISQKGENSAENCYAPEVFCVGLVTNVGKIDDNSFNQSAWEGVQKAKTEGYVDWAQYVETTNSGDYDKNIATFAEFGYDVIVTVNFDLGEATLNATQKYPNINFIGVDQYQSEATQNLAGLNFPEDQAGFLVGALAAMLTKTGKIGAVCGTDAVPPIWRFGEGYRAGAAYIDPKVEVLVVYHNEVGFDKTFIDSDWGATTANSMIDQGADVIFGAGGQTGNGAVIAAAQRGIYVIGVDTDQYYSLPEAAPRMISSALKLIAPGVFDLIKLAKEGNFPSGNYFGDAGYAPFHDLENEISAEVKAKMEEIFIDLKNGQFSTDVSPEKP